MTNQTATDALTSTVDPELEMARVGATAALGLASLRSPALSHRVATARLDLAAAIIAMDEAENHPGRHNLQEQANVELALRAYGQALADLLRGEIVV